MIKQAYSILLCCYFALVSINTIAQDDTTYIKLIGKLKHDITEQEFSSAYQTSLENSQYLGEPDFDYLLGVAALNSGLSAPAVFAFERVVESMPTWYEARLYLAKAYLAANNLPAASSQSLVLINNAATPENIKNNAQLLLVASQPKQLSAKQTYKQSIQVAYGNDNNVNAGTSEDTILIPNLGSFLLSPESKSTEDDYVKLSYKGHYAKPLDEQNSLSFGIVTDWYKFHQLSQYDRVNTNFSGRYQHQFNNNTRLYTQANIAPLFLDGEHYRTESSIMGGASYNLDKRLSLFSGLSLGIMNNAFDEKLDHSFVSLNLGANYTSSTWFQSVGAYYKTENADINEGKYNSRNISSIYYQSNTLLARRWQLLTQAGYQWIDYQAQHPLFLQPRNDNLLMLSGSLKYLVNKDLALQLEVNFQDKSSDIMLFEYDRLDANLSATYSF
ncbi:hypothetical protein [Pseudoalteromonas sp.]|uniref:hypothetical protein n=1 Tax=Pseudoalteromonas sp. TaxID=53249 RepID=UPI003569601B